MTAGHANARAENTRQNHAGGDLQNVLCRTGDHLACQGCDCTCHPRDVRDRARSRFLAWPEVTEEDLARTPLWKAEYK